MEDAKRPVPHEPGTDEAPASNQTSNEKVRQTIPTLYPDIEFINRTLP